MAPFLFVASGRYIGIDEMSGNKVQAGWRLRLRNKFRVDDGNEVQVASSARVRGCYFDIKGQGNRLVISAGANLRGVRLQILGNGCELRVGKGTVIGEECFLSCREEGTHLTVGADGMFSRHVKIMAGDGHDILQDGVKINAARSISIGDHVWLADAVTVLKGVSIGSSAVVGIGSVVTRDVPANAIAAGNPSRIVKEGVTWLR